MQVKDIPEMIELPVLWIICYTLLCLQCSADESNASEYTDGERIPLTTTTRCVFPFNRVAHPDMEIFDCFKSPSYSEGFGVTSQPMIPPTRLGERRDIVADQLDRLLQPNTTGIADKVAYDADEILRRLFRGKSSPNRDVVSLEGRVEQLQQELWPHLEGNGQLRFDSLFESGNLRKAVQVETS